MGPDPKIPVDEIDVGCDMAQSFALADPALTYVTSFYSAC
jgi:hypothetical protein